MQSDGTLTGLYPVSTPAQSLRDGSEVTVVSAPALLFEPPHPKNKTKKPQKTTKPLYLRGETFYNLLLH